MDYKEKKFVEEFNKAKNIVFLTGAGVSTDSGIPDYRGTNGLYLKNPEYMLSRDCWRREYLRFLQFVTGKFSLETFKPNSIHEWIAELEKTKNVTVVTQNIDHLHQNAGSSNVITYHGDMNNWHCIDCDKEYDLAYVREHNYCSCGAKLSPNVVLYGDQIDFDKDSIAKSAIRKADMVIVMGTSLSVYPFADLMLEATSTFSVLINKTETTNFYNAFDMVFLTDINEFIQKIKGEI